MYIRRKVFACLTDEMGEEKLFSVNETILEECENREFSEKEEKKSKIRTAGKIAALTGAGASMAGRNAKNVIEDKTVQKVADKLGVFKIGKGMKAELIGEKVDDAVEMARKALIRNKAFKAASKADKIGAGIALAGTAAYLYGRHKDKNKKNKKS